MDFGESFKHTLSDLNHEVREFMMQSRPLMFSYEEARHWFLARFVNKDSPLVETTFISTKEVALTNFYTIELFFVDFKAYYNISCHYKGDLIDII